MEKKITDLPFLEDIKNKIKDNKKFSTLEEFIYLYQVKDLRLTMSVNTELLVDLTQIS